MSKKTSERIYLNHFLKVVGWPCDTGDVTEGEEPDFIVNLGARLLGVEVTQVFADEPRRGSRMREAESLRLAWLRELAKRYYESGGAPVQLQVATVERPTPEVSAQLVERLLREAEPLSPWTRAEIQLRGAMENLLATAWVTRLPNSQVGYRRGWRMLNDAIGLVRRVGVQHIHSIIAKKAPRLEAYRRRVPDVALLIVADRFLVSGMVAYEGGQLDARGFAGVYLLRYPEGKVEELAPSPAG